MGTSCPSSGYLKGTLLLLNLSRTVVHLHFGEMKTEAPQRPVPMDGALAAVLHCWSTQTWYRQPDDWVFAKQPIEPETLLRCYAQPVENAWVL